MKRVFIVGAGGFGREVCAWLRSLPECGVDWELIGFLDDNPNALMGYSTGLDVVAPVSGFEPGVNDLFACGIGTVSIKMSACKPLIERGARFLTVVHPSVTLGPRVKLGEGVVLCPNVTLTCDIEVGEMAMINCLSSAGHDVRIGAWSTVSAHCDLMGFVELGQRVFMGSGARIIPGKKVGSDAVVGAGSVVIRNVEDGLKVFGNPARVFG